jgi:hypothetical protein
LVTKQARREKKRRALSRQLADRITGVNARRESAKESSPREF